MTKIFAVLLLSSLPSIVWAAPLKCVGTLPDKSPLTVVMDVNHTKLAVNYHQETGLYKIVRVSSRTGDVDFTYHTENPQVTLTLDDQHGDFLSIWRARVTLKCAGR